MTAKRKKKPAKKRDDAFNRMAEAVAAYLDGRGWKVLVSGPARVQQQPMARALKYEFVLDIMAHKKSDQPCHACSGVRAKKLPTGAP